MIFLPQLKIQMKKAWLILIVGLMYVGVSAQNLRTINTPRNDNPQKSDQKSTVDKRPKPPITDYKIISIKGDTTAVDTTLTIQKDYNFNYLRKDNFGLLPFSNVGQPYTLLAHNFGETHLMPQFGARAAHFAYMDVDDINYYHVPTPWTELFFKTTFSQGQLLDAFFTSNISPQVNVFIAYKGLHSLGKYRHLMTTQGSFRIGASYDSKNGRYGLKTHFVSQDLTAEQNGGLTDLANLQYKSKNQQYRDRTVLDVKFEDAENLVRTKRFYAQHHYNIIKGQDSTANNQVRLGHIFNFTDEEYRYVQKKPFELFGTSLVSEELNNLTEYQDVSNLIYAEYQNKTLGKVLFKISNDNYNYGYNRKLYLNNAEIPNRLKGNIYAAGASYENRIGQFDISGDAMLNIGGDFNGNYIKGKAGFSIDSLNRVEAGISINSHQPNYNFILFQQDYVNYNWYNHFENVQRQSIDFSLKSKKIVNLNASYTRIHNYAYFGLKDNPNIQSPADTLIAPYQYDGDINYVKIDANREFNYWRFSLDNTLMYQKTLDGENVFHVPSFVTRNSLYYKDYWFKHNLYLQTGFTFNYFTSFKADGYDPVLAEFYVQNNEQLKGFTRLDFFFNAKVRTARIFFKLENLTTIFDQSNNFAAPYQPYRDFVIRFGIVWDFFL